MDIERTRAELHTNDFRSAGLAWAASYWFSYAYYVPPALLAGQEVRRR